MACNGRHTHDLGTRLGSRARYMPWPLRTTVIENCDHTGPIFIDCLVSF